MQTVAMKPVQVALPDSLQIGGGEGLLGEDGVILGAELDLAARSVIDSIYIEDVPTDNTASDADSVYVISKDRELRLLKYDFPDSLMYDETTGRYVAKTPKYVITDIRYNVEQDNYMWYLRASIILPDVRLSQLIQAEDRKMERKKAKKGFFKNLFKRKKKDAVDSSALQAPVRSEDDFDYIDENGQPQAPVNQPAEPQKKKGLFGFLKKKGDVDGPREEEAPAKEKNKKKTKEDALPAEEDKG